MKRCFVLLLLALHAYTVSGVCECNSDGADVIELSPETNTLFSHTIKCDDESSLPLACNLTITGGADTTVAVAFPSTNLNATDTDNNIAKLLNATGSKLVTVTTTETKELTSTKSHIATVTADLTKNGEVTFQYIAAIGSDTEKACGTPDESRLEVLTLNEDTCISSPNFPTNYPPSQKCSWKVTPGTNLTTIDAEMRFMSVENECNDDADPVEIATDSGLARRNCGKSLQSETWNNVSSVDVVFISDSGSQFPGFLMCFSLQRVDPCTVGEPCNGGTCTPDADLTDFSCTNCPQGLTGKRCNEDPCEGNLCKDGKTCKPCPDCNSTTKNKQWKKCCKQTCKGKGKSGGNRRCVKKCKERKMYYCS